MSEFIVWLNSVTQPFFADWPLWAIVLLCTAGFALWFGLGLWACLALLANLFVRKD